LIKFFCGSLLPAVLAAGRKRGPRRGRRGGRGGRAGFRAASLPGCDEDLGGGVDAAVVEALSVSLWYTSKSTAFALRMLASDSS